MSYCSVRGCFSTVKNNRILFCFPRDRKLFEQWEIFCQDPTLHWSQSARTRRRICDLHFEASMFSLKKGVKCLRPRSLPRLHGPSPPPSVPSTHHNQSAIQHHHSTSVALPFAEQTLETPSDSLVEISSSNVVFESFSEDPCRTPGKDSTTAIKHTDPMTLSTLGMTRSSQLKSPRMERLYKYAKSKEYQLKRLKLKFKKSRMKLKDLCDPDNSAVAAVRLLGNQMSHASTVLLASQFKSLKKKPKGRRWTVTEKTLALSLYKRSPKCYTLLRSFLALPSKKTLKMLVNKLPFQCGINKQVFSTLSQTVGQMKHHDRVCALMFDEMSIKENIRYNSSTDRIDGYEDHGDKGRTGLIANHALVFMIRGLFKKWKQPVAYYFSHGNTTSLDLVELIKIVLNACQEVGLHVVTTVCDMGSANVAALKMLGATVEEPHFLHNNHITFTLFDPPHLIKCTRNLFQKHNVECNVKTRSLNFFGQAKWKHIEEVYKWDLENAEFRLLPNLTDDHLNPKGSQKMKVKLATQIFSHRVSATLHTAITFAKLTDSALATAAFVKQCDNLFDSLNGSAGMKRKSKKPLRCAVTAQSDHMAFWEEAINNVKDWRFLMKNRKKNPPSQNGWLMTLRAVRALWTNLQKDYGVRFLCMRNLNQDALENVFGSVRAHCGSNSNPTVSQFVDALKTCIINGLAFRELKSSNCMEDGADLLSTLQTFLGSDCSFTENPNETSTDVVDNRDIACDVEPGIPSDMSLLSTAYVSGFVARRLLAKNSCVACRSGICTDTSDIFLHAGIEFREYSEEKQRLTYPSQSLVTTVAQCANLIEQILDNNSYQNYLKATIAKVLQKKVSFQWMKDCCEVHYNLTSSRFIESMLSICIPWWCKRQNRRLSELHKGKERRKMNILMHR